MWWENGQCGDAPVPNPEGLPVLVGENVDRCPTSLSDDPVIVELAHLLPGIDQTGELHGVDVGSYPPRVRNAVGYGRLLARVNAENR